MRELIVSLFVLAGALIILSFPFTEVLGHEHPQTPLEVWAAKQQVMPAAKPRFNCAPDSTCSCCANSEIVSTKFKVSKKDGKDEWWWLTPIGNKWEKVPDDIIHPEDEESPTGEPIMFVYPIGTDTPRCFFIGRAGG